MTTQVDAAKQQPVLDTSASATGVVGAPAPAIKAVHIESTISSADTKKEETAAESSGIFSCVGSFFKNLCCVFTWLYNLLCGEKVPEKKEEKPEAKISEKAEKAAAAAVAAAGLASKGALNTEQVVITTQSTGTTSSESAPAAKAEIAEV